MARPSRAVMTRHQQSATSDLFNGVVADRYLTALAASGHVDTACQTAGVARSTVELWRRGDRAAGSYEFTQAEARAKERFGELLVHKSTNAVLNADDAQLVKTPTLAIAAVNWFNPHLRPNGPTVQVNVQVNNTLTPAESERLARAYIELPEDETLA